MTLDKSTRNALRLSVTACRKLLEDAAAELLEGQFGIHRDGTIELAASMTHLAADDRAYREQVVSYLQHLAARRFAVADAVAQLVREVAFTHLNRLCAYKMLERRRLIRETVSRGPISNGFKFYLADHPEDESLWSGGGQDRAYRHFLEWTGRRLGAEMPALFSEHDPANRLFPPQRVLLDVLARINDAELAGIWDEDETAGWIYQYFTPKELRDEARKVSQAPRTSYELAFRNQFYTPRYVVEFLVDNTLGRLWWEMRRGQTSLTELCATMLIKPHPIWLEEGQLEPNAPQRDSDAEVVPYRAKCDPRELRILDPACGSGHFLLYCFDLLLRIYQEIWEDEDLGPALQSEFEGDMARYQAAVPGLILRHNLHGVDIDLRAIQIAGLALWLRAQRAYADLGLARDARPPIRRANLVYAEPMPGEYALLGQFVRALDPPALEPLVVHVWEEMKLAGEAGSLLKVEAALREEIAKAKRAWLATGGGNVQMTLFEQARPPRQQVLSFTGVSDVAFYECEAEPRVLDALRRFAEAASEAPADVAQAATGEIADIGELYTRRLFAEDAARGFALIELLERRYSVVLMNPPFGQLSIPSKAYIERQYPRTKNDLYAAFVERGLELLDPGGRLGAITSRTGFFLTSFQKWREEIVLGEARPVALADLGYGVLDTAMVETAAYVLERTMPATR
ncbi:MAG TPA: DNA methyltransferase [Ktedonobacterales bacterium]|nr:DNA methyltransferase [Ktedonobacterales bacterium]